MSRSWSLLLALGLSLSSSLALAEPSAEVVAARQVAVMERVAADLHARLRGARRDADKRARFDDLVNQAGASLRRAQAVRGEVAALVADGRDPSTRLRELAFLEKRVRELGRMGMAVDGVSAKAETATALTVVVVRPLPDEPSGQ